MTDHDYDDIDGNEPEFDVIEAAHPVGSDRFGAPKDAQGKPVIALMGEFSAGKSTLSNLLIETAVLPVNVTATQLPPVWISRGDEAPYRVALDGGEYDIDLAKLDKVKVHDTAYIRIFHDAPLLERCDIIDMPGISDPNMDADVWRRVIPFADAVLWCTHATQAWRQSEAAVWGMLPPSLYAKSLLLLTRMDKILSERDRMRVMKRVGRETEGLFRTLCPVSLTQALAGKGDADRWEASGAAGLMAEIDALIAEVDAAKSGQAAAAEVEAEKVRAASEPARVVTPMRIRPRPLNARPRSRVSQTHSGADPFAAL